MTVMCDPDEVAVVEDLAARCSAKISRADSSGCDGISKEIGGSFAAAPSSLACPQRPSPFRPSGRTPKPPADQGVNRSTGGQLDERSGKAASHLLPDPQLIAAPPAPSRAAAHAVKTLDGPPVEGQSSTSAMIQSRPTRGRKLATEYYGFKTRGTAQRALPMSLACQEARAIRSKDHGGTTHSQAPAAPRQDEKQRASSRYELGRLIFRSLMRCMAS